jgi:hypothetical protein
VSHLHLKELSALSVCDAADLGELVRAIDPLPGEVMIDARAADLFTQGEGERGVFAITSERVVFAAKAGPIVAMPIGQIYSLEPDHSAGMIATVWYQVLRVAFANGRTRDLILDLLRHRRDAHHSAALRSVPTTPHRLLEPSASHAVRAASRPASSAA